MKPAERAFFLDAIRPYLREGEFLEEAGTAVVLTLLDESQPFCHNRWYIDCPSALGSTGRRQIGRFEQAHGFKQGLVVWTAKSERFLGKGWEKRLLAEFRRLTGLDRRSPITEPEKPAWACICPVCLTLLWEVK